MKKLILSVVAILGFAFAEEGYNKYFLVDRVFLVPFALKHADELELDKEQVSRIKEFIKKNERQIERNRKILKYLSRRAKVMILEGVEERRLREVLADIASVKMEMSLLNAKSVRFLRKTLSEDQFEKLKNIVIIRLFEIQP